MKKYLPFIILGLGLIILIGAFFLIRNSRKDETVEEEEVAIKLSQEQLPFVSIIPSADGHYLTLRIESIKIEAESVDYEILYDLADGRTQGVPGSVKIDSDDPIEREILLGSESSGNFRYDEGVEEGVLTIKFRDENGKLLGKATTEFVLLSNTDKLESLDQQFVYQLTKVTPNYFVVMNSLGYPLKPEFSVNSGPYGVHSSSEIAYPGEVKLEGEKIYQFDSDEWIEIEDGSSGDIGVFISS